MGGGQDRLRFYHWRQKIENDKVCFFCLAINKNKKHENKRNNIKNMFLQRKHKLAGPKKGSCFCQPLTLTVFAAARVEEARPAAPRART